tara:strand:- start:652 stop:987 length:336 start_codon:yes stop_codon:yes gene_type:complete
MGRRRRRRPDPGPSAAEAAAEARRQAQLDTDAMRLRNEKNMAVMQAQLDAVKKASAYSPNMKIASTQGDVKQGLSRKKLTEKKARATKTRDTQIALDPNAKIGRPPGQVNV